MVFDNVRGLPAGGQLFHREQIIDPDDGELLGHVDEAVAIPPYGPVEHNLEHRARWVGGAPPWTYCALPVTADWLLVPIGTQLLTGAREPLRRCQRCEHDVVTAVATDISRTIDAPVERRVIEGTVVDA